MFQKPGRNSQSSNKDSLLTNDEYARKIVDDSPSNFSIHIESSTGLTTAQANLQLEKYGRNVLPEVIIPKWYIFISQLWQPMPIMIWIAAAIEAGIQNWSDMAILLFIQFANASIAYYEITKAGDAVAALKSQLQATATVKRDGHWKQILAANLVPGDLVLLGSGSSVPADCTINHGQVEVDQSALTGESIPVTMHQGDLCKMGSTISRGEQEATVKYTGIETFLGKTASLLKQTTEQSNLQKTLITIITIIVAISALLCTIVLIYLSVNTTFVEALSFTVVLMVASIPLAIEIVTTTTLALGSKELTTDGAIVTRLAAIEDLAGMGILCCDKTGTLTLNKMVIQDETPVYSTHLNQYELLRYAAMATKWNEPPRDALDTLVLNQADIASIDSSVEQLDYLPFDPTIKRTEGTIKEKKSGTIFKITKGAPHVILKLIESSHHQHHLKKGNNNTNTTTTSTEIESSKSIMSTLKTIQSDIDRLGMRGIRTLAIAKSSTITAITANSDENDETVIWNMLGLLTFLDPPRSDTKQTIIDAQSYGVDIKMITGDNVLIACETARQLNMGGYMKSSQDLPLLDPITKNKPANLSRDYGEVCLAADGFAEVFPEHKYLIVECLRELGYKVGMTGDGVNDAPALKRADVGIAVMGCTDAARAAADIVLTREGLSTIIKGIVIARKIFVRIRNFIIYRIAATLQLLVFFFIAVLSFHPVKYMPTDWRTNPDFPDKSEWPSFFHMPVLMLMLITLLNDGTLIAIGYDHVIPRRDPEKWNIPALFAVSIVLALVALISSIILLHILLSSWYEVGGKQGLSIGQVITSIYLKVSISDFLTLFSVRTGDQFFWATRPAPVLMIAGFVALAASTTLACAWPSSSLDGIYTLGLGYREPKALSFYVWIYCLVWWLIQDICKVYFYSLMKRYNWFNWNDTGKVVLSDTIKKYKEDNMILDMEGHIKNKLHTHD